MEEGSEIGTALAAPQPSHSIFLSVSNKESHIYIHRDHSALASANKN